MNLSCPEFSMGHSKTSGHGTILFTVVVDVETLVWKGALAKGVVVDDVVIVVVVVVEVTDTTKVVSGFSVVFTSVKKSVSISRV